MAPHHPHPSGASATTTTTPHTFGKPTFFTLLFDREILFTPPLQVSKSVPQKSISRLTNSNSNAKMRSNASLRPISGSASRSRMFGGGKDMELSGNVMPSTRETETGTGEREKERDGDGEREGERVEDLGKMYNADCPVQVLLDHLRRDTGNIDCGNVDLVVEKTGQVVGLLHESVAERKALEFLTATGKYVLARAELREAGNATAGDSDSTKAPLLEKYQYSALYSVPKLLGEGERDTERERDEEGDVISESTVKESWEFKTEGLTVVEEYIHAQSMEQQQGRRGK